MNYIVIVFTLFVGSQFLSACGSNFPVSSFPMAAVYL